MLKDRHMVYCLIDSAGCWRGSGGTAGLKELMLGVGEFKWSLLFYILRLDGFLLEKNKKTISI